MRPRLEEPRRAPRGLDRPMTEKLFAWIGGSEGCGERGPPTSKAGWIAEHVHDHHRLARRVLEELDEEIGKARGEMASARREGGRSPARGSTASCDRDGRGSGQGGALPGVRPQVLARDLGGDPRGVMSIGMAVKETTAALDGTDAEARDMLEAAR